MSGALVAQAINGSIGTADFQGLDAILKEYLGLIAKQAGTARVPISRTINGHSLASDVDLDNNDVGAAPTGFGLGTFAAIMPNSDFNKIWRCGMYRFGSDGENRPPFSDWGYLTVMSPIDYNRESIQIAFRQASANVCVMRTKSRGVWSEWEWVNPPLIAGVEYRTTERHDGKPVYVKEVEFGELPNTSTKTKESVLNTNITALSATGYAKTATTSKIIPCSDVLIEVNNEWGHVICTTKSNLSGHNAYIAVKYIKN